MPLSHKPPTSPASKPPALQDCKKPEGITDVTVGSYIGYQSVRELERHKEAGDRGAHTVLVPRKWLTQ